MYKKNELKNLIYIQENEQCNEQTVKGLFRSIVEPILESTVESLVMLRLGDKSKSDFDSIIKRLGFSSADVYDFSDAPVSEKFENVLAEKIWDKTEFIYVLSQRYGAVLIFDYEESSMQGFAQYYILHNSKNLTTVFELINSNSKKDLQSYESNWRPDRRENDLLNYSIRKIVGNLNEVNQEVMISELEKEQISGDQDAAAKLEFLSTKSGYIAHEMKNLFSICNLYSDIIDKQSHKITFKDKETEKSVLNARDCIRRAIQMSSSMLFDLRSLRSTELKEYSLQEILNNAIEMSKVYAGDGIKIINNIKDNVKIMADEYKLLEVLINLVKNAVESMGEKGEIIFSSELADENVIITVSNTGSPINEELQAKIFEEGFSTKKEGRGFGLKICQKTMEEQYGKLKLKKSDEKSTDFELTILKG